MILTNATLMVGGHDLSGVSNNIALEFTATELPNTTFRNGGAVTRQAGMKDVSGSFEGFYEPAIEGVISNLGTAQLPVVVAPSSEIGSPAFTFQASILSYSFGGEVDSLVPLTATFANSGRAKLNQAKVMFSPLTPVSTTEVFGSGVELGALTSGNSQTFVFTNPSATAITVKVQTATSNAWSSPTTERTVSVPANSSVTESFTSAITRTWWRVSATGTAASSLIGLTY